MAAATLTLGAAVAVGGCGGGTPPELTAADAAVGSNPGSSAALYVELENSGGTDDTLVGASCDCAGRASLHVASHNVSLGPVTRSLSHRLSNGENAALPRATNPARGVLTV